MALVAALLHAQARSVEAPHTTASAPPWRERQRLATE